MAMPTSPSAQVATPSAQVVGNAFVAQYYQILHHSPELVYKFYQDSSVLSRPDSNGVMTSVTTMDAINEKILSLEYNECKSEIKTVDAQNSYKDGVLVLVTGCLTGKDNLTRKFTQSFFLAPQDKGYFVFNDVFRYVDENESLEANLVAVNGVVECDTTAPLNSDPEPAHVSDQLLMEVPISPVEVSVDNVEEVCDPSDNEEGSVVDLEVVTDPPPHSSQDEGRSTTELASSIVPEDAPKKSYASIVKVSQGKTGPTPVYVARSKVAINSSARVTSGNSEQQSAPAPGSEASGPSSNNMPESSNDHMEVQGHSIYIRSLPMHATVVEVEEEFKKFGPIKHGGIQVRNNKQQGYCFGFVEFESSSSMHSAVEASSVIMGGRQVYIEEKKTTSRGGSGRGRFIPGRNDLQNDNFRGRGNFNSGRGQGRNDYGYRGEYSGRGGRGPAGRGGESYQKRVDQSGSTTRGGRQGGVNNVTVPV